MAIWRELASEINECQQLWLEKIESTVGWGLLVEVSPGPYRGPWPENIERDFAPELAAKLIAEHAPRILAPRRIFEIRFKECIQYAVTNETYALMSQEPEVFVGKLFREFSWSYLLQAARKNTYASDEHPGPLSLTHFEIVCQDDVIDVIACVEPEIFIRLESASTR